METLQLNADFGTAIMRAAGVLRAGGVILYPTDTLYGLGADAFSDQAVDTVYAIKGRQADKPIHCIVTDLAMAEEYGEINDAARTLAEAFLPGPLTLVVKKKADISGGIARGMETIGIRIPNNDFCIELARSFGRPYTTTSANLADVEPEIAFKKVLAQLGTSQIDLAIDAGDAPLKEPSTVVNVVSGHPSILREGAIPAKDILGLF
ncbi:MAG TPA: L-threonylcarbamoyladenylate synthase [Candidatus Paceibacterota bacterium]|nr:L-threonylcarbamoyladenylate synthase [Candidatus Paceibacterota bacterium]